MILYIVKYVDKHKIFHTLALRNLIERNKALYEIHRKGYSAELETVEVK